MLVMKARPVPPLTPEDIAAERLAEAVEFAIGVIQERLADLDNERDAQWSVSDLVKLLQLRKQLAGERTRTVYAYWVDRRDAEDDSGPDGERPDTRPGTSVPASDLPIND
jgi:hypothetical protein